MLDTDTKRRIDSCRDILVGKVPDPKSQVEQITIALIYKFMDDMDAEAEEFGGTRTFFAGEYAKYGWSKLMAPNMGGFDMLALYSEAIQKMNENPGVPALFREIFKNAYLPYRDPETLRGFLKEIDSFTYDHSERLGDAFEYLLSVLGSQGDAGQFRTPRHIIDFMVEIIDPKKDETVLDTACGTAGFLISSYKHILKHNSKDYKPKEDHEAYDEKGVHLEALTLESPMHYKGDLLTPDERKRLAGNIKGYDISPDMVRLSLVNLYLHGFSDPHIFEYDTLTSEERWNEYADIILANPPFMSPKGGIKPHKRFSMQATRSEVLFVDYIAEHLTPNGRAAVVVPEGIIFQSGTAYKKLREMLVKNSLVAVISLPAGVFNPYSGVKTSILVMDKKLAKKTDAVLFAKIVNDGYNLGAQRRPIDKNDLLEAARVIKKWLNFRQDLQDQQDENNPVNPVDPVKNNLAFLVSRERIGENGEWNLSGERYRENTVTLSDWPFVPVGQVFDKSNSTVHPDSLNSTVAYIGLENITQNTGMICGDLVVDNPSEIKSLKNVFVPNEILYGKLRPNLNKVWLSDREGICSTDIFVIRPKDNLTIPAFYSYIFRSNQFNDAVLSELKGAQLPRVGWSSFAEIKIPLPPFEVQKEIVAEIEGYQKIINGAWQVVENYKPRIDIDPDWPMVELGEVCKPGYGFTATAQDKGSHRFIRITDINTEGYLKKEDAKFIDISDDSIKYVLKSGDILVARTGATYGKTMIFSESEPAIYASYLIRLKMPEDRILPKFYWAFAQSENYWKQANALVTGGGQPQFNGNVLVSVSFPLPDLVTQRAIVAQIEEEQRLVNANKELIRLFEAKIKATINRVWGESE